MKFINTELFRTEALHFKKYGRYCDSPYGTSEFMKYWEEQANRCRNGYSVGGVKITGNHYFYLNFCQIKLTSEESEKIVKGKQRVGKKQVTFPDFWDGDYEYFWVIDIARNGISENDFKKLDLSSKPLYLDGGYNLMVLKARRKGFSYKNASLVANMYTFNRKSLSVVGAFESKYLYPDGTMSMISNYLNFIDENTAWTKRRLINTRDHIKSGFKEVINGVEIIKGYQSTIDAITFKDKPDASRGRDVSLMLIEEIGTFSNVKSAYAAILPSLQDGNVVTGFLCGFGCVCAGTKVWTSSGYPVNIEDLKQEDGILGYSCNTTYPEVIDWMKPPANKPCYTITTTSGTTISCSEDHPILWSKPTFSYNKRITVDGKRKVIKVTKKAEFKETKDIKVKDQIAVITEVPIFGDKDMWNPRLVGMLIGDGSYGHDKTPRLSNCDDEINSFIDNNFDTIVEKSYLTKTNKLYRETRIKGICKYLRELGIYGQTKLKKTLPENIHQYNKESLAQLIAGLFDTDGYIGKTNIVLTSSCKPLVLEVKEILIKFGIRSIIYEVNSEKYGRKDRKIKDVNNYFRLIISDSHSIVNFSNSIPLIVSYKRQNIKILAESLVNTDLVDIVYVEKNPNNKNYVDTTDLRGIRFETVKSVEYIGEQPVYNLTTSTTHTYIANNIITHNTGGMSQAGILDFESMFYDPLTYRLLPFENIWDEVANGECGFFFPDYQNKVGFIDKEGNSDIKGAQDYENARRDEIKRSAKDPQALDKYIVERPFNPREGFLQVSSNIFPIAELQRWRSKILSSKDLLNVGVAGRILRDSTGLKFRPDNSLRPIVDFPAKRDTDLTGCIVQYQAPFKDGAGNVPNGLYIIVVDPYAHDNTTGVSIGAAYVIKRINNFSLPDDMIVASYVGRPMTQDIYNDNLFLLAEYYNAKIGFENDRGNIIDYARFHNKTKFLIEEIELIDKKENINFKKLGRNYGMSMGSKDRKGQATIYLRDWLRTERGKGEDGDVKMNLHFIFDIALLDELIKYNPDGNYDRVSSLLVGMYFLKDSYRKEIQLAMEEDENSFFNRAMY